MGEFPRDLRRCPQFPLHADLADTSAGCRSEPEMMLPGAVDLRFEPFRCGGHEGQSIWESIAPEEREALPDRLNVSLRGVRQTHPDLGFVELRSLGLEPRTCGLRVPEKCSDTVRWSPLSRGFVRTIVQLIRPRPVQSGELGTKLGTPVLSEPGRVRLRGVCRCRRYGTCHRAAEAAAFP